MGRNSPLASALVLLTPASPAGILALRVSVIRSFWSGITQWGFWRKPYRQTFAEAAYSMLHLLPEDEQRRVYDSFTYVEEESEPDLRRVCRPLIAYPHLGEPAPLRPRRPSCLAGRLSSTIDPMSAEGCVAAGGGLPRQATSRNASRVNWGAIMARPVRDPSRNEEEICA